MWFDGLWLYGFRLRQTISWDEKQAIKFILEVSEILFKIQFPSDIGGQMNVLLEDNSFTIFAFKINLLRKNKLLQSKYFIILELVGIRGSVLQS